MLVLGPVAAFADEPKLTPVQQGNQYVPPKPKKGFRYPDCFCTDSTGQRIELRGKLPPGLTPGAPVRVRAQVDGWREGRAWLDTPEALAVSAP